MWPCPTHQPLSLGEALRWQMLIAPRDQAAVRCQVHLPLKYLPLWKRYIFFMKRGNYFYFCSHESVTTELLNLGCCSG